MKRANNWAATSCDATNLNEAIGIARSTTMRANRPITVGDLLWASANINAKP